MKILLLYLIFPFISISCRNDSKEFLDTNGWDKNTSNYYFNKKKVKNSGIKLSKNSKVTAHKPVFRNIDTKGIVPKIIHDKNKNSFSSVKTQKNVLAITFDDGPHGVNTPRLLDILASRQVKATFYVVGNNVKAYPAIMKRIVNEGHEVGNHTYTHPSLTKLSLTGVESQVTRAAHSIYNATGVYPRTIRPPFGAINGKLRNFFKERYGYSTIMWSVDPNDWRRPGVSVVANRILKNAHPGAIILVHDIHKPSIDAMPRVLDGLLSKGYQFLTISQLLDI